MFERTCEGFRLVGMDNSGWDLPGAPDVAPPPTPQPSALIVAFRQAVDALLQGTATLAGATVEGLAVDIAELTCLRDRVNGFFAAQVATFDARGGGQSVTGARSTRTWLSATTRMTSNEANTMVRVGRRCFGGAGRQPTLPKTGAALLAGSISVGHANEVTIAVMDLPAAAYQDAEVGLLAAAAIMDPVRLRNVTADLRHQLVPQVASSQEASARNDREFWWTTTFGGMVAGGFTLAPEAEAFVRAALEPLAMKAGPDDDRSLGQRRADGFLELLATAQPGKPAGQFTSPEIVITIPAETLLAIPGAPAARIGMSADTGLGDGAPISDQAAKRLSCDAIVAWMHLDPKQRTLALGRSARTAPKWLRRSIEARDNHCRWQGCLVEARRCQVHHIRHWCDNGVTEPGNCILLCWFHHDLTHHEGWTVDGNANEVLTFTPPGISARPPSRVSRVPRGARQSADLPHQRSRAPARL